MVQNKKEENDIAHNFVPILIVLLRILKIKDVTCGRLGRKQIKNYIFPPKETSDSIEKRDTAAAYATKSTENTKYGANRCPKIYIKKVFN